MPAFDLRRRGAQGPIAAWVILALVIAAPSVAQEAEPQSIRMLLVEKGACRPWLAEARGTDCPTSDTPAIGLAHIVGFRFLEDRQLAWSREERALAWSYVALSAFDAWQTTHLPPGYREVNPLLTSWAGERPSPLATFAFKAATSYGILRLADRLGSTHRRRRLALRLIVALELGITVRNERVTSDPPR